MNDVQNFESCWKYSNFGRNSYVLKVLAHKESGEIKKKMNQLIELYQDERLGKL